MEELLSGEENLIQFHRQSMKSLVPRCFPVGRPRSGHFGHRRERSDREFPRDVYIIVYFITGSNSVEQNRASAFSKGVAVVVFFHVRLDGFEEDTTSLLERVGVDVVASARDDPYLSSQFEGGGEDGVQNGGKGGLGLVVEVDFHAGGGKGRGDGAVGRGVDCRVAGERVGYVVAGGRGVGVPDFRGYRHYFGGAP